MRSALAFLRPFVSGSRSRRVLARLESQDVEDPATLFGLFGLLGHASAPAVLYLACLLPHPPRHVDLPGIRRAYRAHAAAALACMATPVLLARSPPAVRAPAPLRRAFQAYARDEFLALLPLLHAQFAALRVATAALGPADFDLLVRGRGERGRRVPGALLLRLQPPPVRRGPTRHPLRLPRRADGRPGHGRVQGPPPPGTPWRALRVGAGGGAGRLAAARAGGDEHARGGGPGARARAAAGLGPRGVRKAAHSLDSCCTSSASLSMANSPEASCASHGPHLAAQRRVLLGRAADEHRRPALERVEAVAVVGHARAVRVEHPLVSPGVHGVQRGGVHTEVGQQQHGGLAPASSAESPSVGAGQGRVVREARKRATWPMSQGPSQAKSRPSRLAESAKAASSAKTNTAASLKRLSWAWKSARTEAGPRTEKTVWRRSCARSSWQRSVQNMSWNHIAAYFAAAFSRGTGWKWPLCRITYWDAPAPGMPPQKAASRPQSTAPQGTSTCAQTPSSSSSIGSSGAASSSRASEGRAAAANTVCARTRNMRSGPRRPGSTRAAEKTGSGGQTRMQSAPCVAAAPSRGSRRGAFGRHASRREELPSLAAPEVAKFHQRQLYLPMLVCSWPHSYVLPCFGQARGLRWVASEYAAACYAGTRLHPVRMPGPAKRSCCYGAGSRELGEESCQRGCWLRLSVKIHSCQIESYQIAGNLQLVCRVAQPIDTCQPYTLGSFSQLRNTQC
uniref:Uncharacterized protein n=2 Tax=Spironucleus salmonicida TaxID=348837 RepID=V6LPX7_9EUKA|eukprot:EST46717.1 Hypothetical protein SS50377_13259 [Spironucleus salmonicida]